MTDDAVESILKIHKKYRSQNNICGYAFLRAFPDGKVNGKKFDVDEKIGSYIDVRVNGNDTGADKAEVFKTHCLKEFPFPEYPNEKFLGEDLVWVRMARKYEMVHINKAIYVGNYLEDGLTNNRRKHNIASPIGCMHRAEEFMEPDLKTRYRIKGGLQYIVYGRFAGVKVVDLICRQGKRIRGVVGDFGQGVGNGYYVEKSMIELRNLTRQEWQTRLAGQMVSTGTELQVTSYEELRSFIQEELGELFEEDVQK